MTALFHLANEIPVTSSGSPYGLAKLYFYRAGTTTHQAVYTTAALSVAHDQPVVADAAGVFPAIFLDPGATYDYRYQLKTSADVLIKDIDNYPKNGFPSASYLAALIFPQTSLETSNGYTPDSFLIQPQNPMPKRLGAAGDNNGTATNGTDDTAELAKIATTMPRAMVDLGGLRYRVNASGSNPAIPAGLVLFNGDIVDDRMVTTQDEYSNTSLGWLSLQANTYIPEQHAASGGRFFASGNANVAIGREAMKANTTGRRNTAVGSRSMITNTTGYYNTGLGSHTLEVCTTGDSNVAVGVQSLQRVVNATSNTMVGVGSGLGLTSGSNNVGVGLSCVGGVNGGATVTTGNYNVGVGYRAIYALTTGEDNVGVGRDSLVSLTEGTQNVAIGAHSLLNVIGGDDNTAVGYNALRLATGDSHVAVGAFAGDAITTGLGLTAVGQQSLTAATGDYNTAVGITSGRQISTGANNTLMGREAGATITTGGNNACFGYGADVSAAGATNQNIFGYNAAGTADNQVVLGNGSISSFRCQVALTVVSDMRYKVRLGELPGLAVVTQIDTFRARFKKRKGADASKSFASLSAQNLKLVQKKLGVDLGLVDESNPDQLGATYERLIPVLVKSIQELNERVELLEAA